MKKAKRLLALVAMLIYAVATLTACGGDPVELLAFIDDSATEIDYEGYQFTYYFDGTDAEYDEDESILGYDRNTLQGEAMLKRIADIKEQINVEIVFNCSHTYSTYQTAAMSGNSKADAIQYSYMNAMQVLAQSGFLYPVTDFPDYIDLSDTDKYGAANVLEPAMINSVPYAVLPCFWLGSQPLENHILCYNKDLVLGNGITDFHEFWEAENWTWETFENEFLAKAKVETSDGYIPALSTWDIAYFDMLMYSNNVQFVTKNDAGETVANPYPAAFIEAYEQGLEWVQNYPDTVDISQDMHDFENFLYGNAMTALVSAESVTTGGVAYNKLSTFLYGLMPFPAGPSATYGVWAQFVERMPGMGIATSSAEPEIAAHTISLWLEPFEEFGGRDGLYDFYNSNTFITETDTEIFFALMENVRYDYTFWDQSDVGREMAYQFGSSIKQGRGVAEAMEKNVNIINEMVYDYILPNFDYMYENYYYQFDN